MNNTNASLFAGINATSGLPKNRPFASFVGGAANALLPAGCKVLAAGNFTPSSSQPCSNLAIYDVFSQQLEGACALFEFGDRIHALARVGNDLYLGGNFIKVNGSASAPYFQQLRFPAGYFDGCAMATTVAAGNWDSPLIWEGGAIPAPGARVLIRHAVTLNRPVECLSVEVAPGAALQLQAAGRVNIVN